MTAEHEAEMALACLFGVSVDEAKKMLEDTDVATALLAEGTTIIADGNAPENVEALRDWIVRRVAVMSPVNVFRFGRAVVDADKDASARARGAIKRKAGAK